MAGLKRPFPEARLRLVLWAYKVAWVVLFPLVLVYLAWRGRREPAYLGHLAERFGFAPSFEGAVWVHAVSLGEMRSAVPLIRAMLGRGDRVVTTHFTPTGRAEAEKVFSTEIAEGRFRAVWVPFEFRWTYRLFLRRIRPRYGLVMEVEIWPEMLLSARALGVPLYLCNAQYPSLSFERDQGGARAALIRGYSGALVKSELQRERFASVGLDPIEVTGELRFDQPIPAAQTSAALAVRSRLAQGRSVITFASVVEGEDETYLAAITALPRDRRPLIVYVPRKPERFDKSAALIRNAGLTVARRSDIFDAGLALRSDTAEFDVLLGDSMGEMYFYLALCDRAVVGGGFTSKGAHNVIEPLALRKPVIVGPEIWTIEYPAVEAIAAGVCSQVGSIGALSEALTAPTDPSAIDSFFRAHAGAVDRTLAAIDRLTRR